MTLRSFFTLLTPETAFAIPSARSDCLLDSTVPDKCTTPSVVSTFTLRDGTISSASNFALISLVTAVSPTVFEQAFDMLFPDDAPCDGSLLTNARQADAIVRAKKSVDAALRSLRAGFTPDAVLVDLEAAMRALGEVTGRTMREDITNRIFERFCVGK